MVHVERHFFKVPEKRRSDKLISLDRQVFEPTHPAGTIIFAPGFGAGNLDFYDEFLTGVADRGFRVVTFSYRGAGSSQGSFNSAASVNDLETIVRQVKGEDKVALMAHSLGAAYTVKAAQEIPNSVSSVYLFNPCLSPSFLPIIAPLPTPTPVRPGLWVLYFLSRTPLRKKAEKVVNEWYQKKSGHQLGGNTFLALAEITRAKYHKIPLKMPLGFVLTDTDWDLGTLRNASRYRSLVRKIENLGETVEDQSYLISGLNHRLNNSLNKPFAQDCHELLVHTATQFAQRYATQ